MRWLTKLVIAFGCMACHTVDVETVNDVVEFGRLIAANLDEINGVPVELNPQVLCSEYYGSCDTDAGILAPPRAVSAMVTAFSRALGIPQLPMTDSDERPRCEWSVEGAEPDDRRQGLVAQFHEPRIVGDSASVLLTTRCEAVGRRMRGFRQSHEFIFRRDTSGVWKLETRRLRSIT